MDGAAVAVQARQRPRRRARPSALRAAILERLGGAIDHYEEVVALPIPDKLPLPLQVHRRHGEPCPRCGTTIEAVHYEDYVLCYCPRSRPAVACSRTAGCPGC